MLQIKTRPFTYLIGWTSLNKFYYGVRHARGCSPKDLWTKYFTSSKEVQKYRALYGEPDVIQIRKVFETSEQALLWERRVLKRLNVARNDRFLNMHNGKGFVIKCGEDNPSKRPEVKQKLREYAANRPPQSRDVLERARIKRTKHHIARILKKSYIFKPAKSKEILERLNHYIEFVKEYKPNCKFVLSELLRRLQICTNYKPIRKKSNMPNKQKGVKKPSSTLYRLGKVWYTNTITGENKLVAKDTVLSEEWVRGLNKITPKRVYTDQDRQYMSEVMKRHRAEESETARAQRLEKYHETIEKRKSKID